MFELVGVDGSSLPLVVAESIDLVLDLTPDEVQAKLRAIDCHQSQLEEWRVLVRNHPDLLQREYGNEVYVNMSSRGSRLTRAGLLSEFA